MIAHPVNAFEDVAIGAFVAVGPGGEPVTGVGHLYRRLVAFQDQGLRHFQALAGFLIERVEEVREWQFAVVEAEIQAETAEAIGALPPLEIVTPGPEAVSVSRKNPDPEH